MAWINEEFAEEVAVLTTWLAVLLPWSISYTADAPLKSRIFFFRFPAFGLQLRFPTEVARNGEVVDVGLPGRLAEQYGGFGLFGNVHGELPPLQLGTVDGQLALTYTLWSIASLVMVLAVVLSIAMYLREDAVQDLLPFDYVRLTAIVFGVLTVLLGAATVVFSQSDAAYGSPVPLGVVLFAAFAVLLWRAERVPDGE